MDKNKFLLKVEGKGFVINLQGEGNPNFAKVAVSNAFGGLPVSVLNIGIVDRADIDGH